MTMPDTTPTDRAPRSPWARGLALGLLAGTAAWVAYFVQASTLDQFSWETTVVPALGIVAVGAVVVALLRPSARGTSLAVAVGTLLTLPIVLGAFLVVFTVLHLE